MIATQPAADEFWDEQAQKFFAEEDNDAGFDVALDPDAKYVDRVDSDFDDDESDAGSESEQEEEKKAKSKAGYVDPRNRARKKVKVEQPTAPTVAPAMVPVEPVKKEKRVYKKKLVASSDRVVRRSTKQATEVANISEQLARKVRRKNVKRVVRLPTQAEILREADKTERKNIASLHAIRKWEEAEKLRRKPKGPVLTGPRVVYHSKGDKTFISFRDCDGYQVLTGCLRALEGRTAIDAPALPEVLEPGPVYGAALTACDLAPPPMVTPASLKKTSLGAYAAASGVAVDAAANVPKRASPRPPHISMQAPVPPPPLAAPPIAVQKREPKREENVAVAAVSVVVYEEKKIEVKREAVAPSFTAPAPPEIVAAAPVAPVVATAVPVSAPTAPIVIQTVPEVPAVVPAVPAAPAVRGLPLPPPPPMVVAASTPKSAPKKKAASRKRDREAEDLESSVSRSSNKAVSPTMGTSRSGRAIKKKDMSDFLD